MPGRPVNGGVPKFRIGQVVSFRVVPPLNGGRGLHPSGHGSVLTVEGDRSGFFYDVGDGGGPFACRVPEAAIECRMVQRVRGGRKPAPRPRVFRVAEDEAA